MEKQTQMMETSEETTSQQTEIVKTELTAGNIVSLQIACQESRDACEARGHNASAKSIMRLFKKLETMLFELRTSEADEEEEEEETFDFFTGKSIAKEETEIKEEIRSRMDVLLTSTGVAWDSARDEFFQLKQRLDEEEEETPRIPKGFQKNKVNLTLSNSELDYFEMIVKNRKGCSESMRNHILARICIARSNQ